MFTNTGLRNKSKKNYSLVQQLEHQIVSEHITQNFLCYKNIGNPAEIGKHVSLISNAKDQN